jgi:hypothetical protein
MFSNQSAGQCRNIMMNIKSFENVTESKCRENMITIKIAFTKKLNTDYMKEITSIIQFEIMYLFVHLKEA